MPRTTTYYVKREPALFRKPRWVVHLEKQKIGERDSEEAALAAAVEQAERSAELGRTVEIWANNGEGFVLYRSFQPIKKKKGEDDEEDVVNAESGEDADAVVGLDLL